MCGRTWTITVALGALVLAAGARSWTQAQGSGAGVGAPSAAASAPRQPGFTYGDLHEVTLKGTIIALGEEMARSYGARTQGGGSEVQYALRLPEGTIYTFLDNGRYRALIDGGRRQSQPVEVKANQFPKSMILEVLEFRPLPPDALRVTYFCRTCVITSDRPGPCICCGEEMELRRDP